MPCRVTLARATENSKLLLLRFVNGFDDSNRTRQAEHLPNHVSWTLGHCALTMHRAAENHLKDGLPLPDEYFITGDGTKGNTKQYDTESICFGSRPVDDPSRYPPIARGIEVYEAACDRLAEAIRNATEEKLDELIPWHDGDMPVWSLILRICFHNGTHAGQLVDLRRALGMKPVIGG